LCHSARVACGRAAGPPLRKEVGNPASDPGVTATLAGLLRPGMRLALGKAHKSPLCPGRQPLPSQSCEVPARADSFPGPGRRIQPAGHRASLEASA